MTDKPLLQAGKTYLVDHVRKGQFSLRITEVGGDWVVGVVVAGTARHISSENVWVGGVGTKLTIRIALAHFTEVEKEKA